jgi:hypothetical protein
VLLCLNYCSLHCVRDVTNMSCSVCRTLVKGHMIVFDTSYGWILANRGRGTSLLLMLEFTHPDLSTSRTHTLHYYTPPPTILADYTARIVGFLLSLDGARWPLL